MQITRQSEYAIRTMLELAKSPKDTIVSSKVISERQSIPELFLKKTVQLLVTAGLLTTHRGTQGGIRLAKDPATITIADVLTAIEGPLAINICLSPESQCPNQPKCVISPVLARAQNAFLKELSKDNFADLADKSL